MDRLFIDDSLAENLRWNETGYGGIAPVMQWSVKQHLTIYSVGYFCGNGDVHSRDLNSGKTVQVPGVEAALSHSGTIVTILGNGTLGLKLCESPGMVAMVHPAGAPGSRAITTGELPTWGIGDKHVYFVQRTTRQVLGDPMDYATRACTSSIWRANGDGSHLQRLLVQDVFAFGPLQLTADGQSLIFSSVENPWNIWRHQPTTIAGYTPDFVKAYGPQVSVRMLNLSTGKLTTLVHNAGRPAVQP